MNETYRAAVDGGSDVRVVVVRHLFVIGAQEAHGFVVRVLVLVVPSHGLVTVVGEVLSCRRAEQTQERHLDDADGISLCVHV